MEEGRGEVRVWAVTFQYEHREEGKKPSGGLGLGTDASFIIKFTWRQFLPTLSVIADWSLGSLLSLSLAVTFTHFDIVLQLALSHLRHYKDTMLHGC